MTQHGADDTTKEKKQYVYPIFTRVGYTLIAITDEERIAKEYILENDNHIRRLFYMKKEVADVNDILDDDEAYMLCVCNLSDVNGYTINSQRRWMTNNDFDKMMGFIDGYLFDLFEIIYDLRNTIEVLNLPDEVYMTLSSIVNKLQIMEGIFIDEDILERVAELFEHLSYDKITDMIFDYNVEYIVHPEEYRTRKARTIF